MNLNKQQSDIINYRPDLKMENIPSLGSTFGDSNNGKLKVDIKPTLVEKSLNLSTFEQYSPYTVLEGLETLIDRAEEYKVKLRKQMSSTHMGSKYLNAKDDETRKNIEKENALSVHGTTYLECYSSLEYVHEELLGIKEVYSLGTYGDDIQSGRAREIDMADIDRIYTLEREQETENVNYTSIYYETLVSAILQKYCFDMDEYVLCDIGNLNEFSKSMPKNDKLVELMSQNFQKKGEILQKDIFKDKKTSYNIRVALRNTFLAIQEYEDSLDAIRDSLTDMDNDVLALEMQRDLLSNLSESMEDLLSSTTYSVMAKQDIAKSLLGKSNIREYFIE